MGLEGGRSCESLFVFFLCVCCFPLLPLLGFLVTITKRETQGRRGGRKEGYFLSVACMCPSVSSYASFPKAGEGWRQGRRERRMLWKEGQSGTLEKHYDRSMQATDLHINKRRIKATCLSAKKNEDGVKGREEDVLSLCLA